jgi:outer membrane receptor protein involved in Fe transport
LFGELSRREGPIDLSGAVRLDHWQIADGKRLERSLPSNALLSDDRFPSRHGWLPTARIAAGVELGHGLTWRSAAYTGWRLPTLNELFRPFRVGSDATAANPELDPERLVGMETGLRWQHGSMNLSLTAFANRLRDPIANVTLGTGPGLFPGVGFVPARGAFRQRQNLDAIKVAGVEVSGKWQRGPWSLAVSSSLVDPTVVDRGGSRALDGLRPAQTPRFTASGTGGWQSGRTVASLALRYVGSQYEDDLNTEKLSGAFTMDGYAALPLFQRVQLQFRAENLLNKRVVAGISGDQVIERATPRTLWLGLLFASERP